MNSEPKKDFYDPDSGSGRQAEAIRASLVHQLYARGVDGSTGALLGAAILTVSLWNLLPRLHLVLWFSAYVAVHLVRRLIVKSYFPMERGGTDSRVWELRFAAGNIAGGLLWGMAAVVLFPVDSVPHQYMMALFIAGISCGAAVFYWPSTVACIPTVIVELVPASGRFFAKGDETGVITGIVILFFCVVVSLMARHIKSFAVESLKLRFDKEALLESLRKSRDELETRVEERTNELSCVNEALRHEIRVRIRAEESLSKSEERYRLVVENVQESIFVAQDGRLKFVNPATVELFRYPESDLLSKQFVEFIHPDDREMVQRNHVKRLRGEDFPRRYQFRILHASGAVRWVEINSVLIQWDGMPASLVFTTDVTDRRAAEEAVRESERRFRMLLEDVSSVPVQGYDEDRKVLFWNSASERLYGYSRGEAMGMKLEDLIIPPQMRGEVVSAVDNWVKNGERIPAGELGLMHKSGAIVPVYSTHVMLDNPAGRKEMYCVDLDLAGLKKAEEERASLKDQLREAQKMEAVGRLAGGIAHDFNNLLQVTFGFSEILLEGKTESDRDYADLQKIYQASKSGAELVKQLLTFGRKVEPNPTALSLNNAIVQVERLLSRTIPKMVEIRMNLAADLRDVNADNTQMEQVLVNLALNAGDAMPDGGKLTIRTANVTLDEEYCRLRAEALPGDYVLLTVTDTGHGMDHATVQHIFEPFFTTKELGRGTGLGLAMVYGIVKQHGGHIACHSQVGKGTTFEIYLPAMTEIPFVPESDHEPVLAGGTETVLLVDDDDLVRDLGKRILVRNGYKVLTAVNGADALEMVNQERERIDLIILDLIMPVMGGKDFLKSLRKAGAEVRVIIASGYSSDGSARECLDLGARGYVAKPFATNDLLKSVRDALDA